ncbi:MULTISPECIES: CAP domain-containing protein [Streptomyces]|uniref:SCP-like extracellular n=2 Tax=Streptomyces TaxID=1883 RepID=A0A100Y6E4_9ACTN|nr:MULTISPECIES: CAP domain-containing protein [Streptomyces]KUH38477.1 SCP-like extracellular [Streptomyces kanasensis]UUS33155.1 CAP domain-containing protein [Streptomyces changanensis]
MGRHRRSGAAPVPAPDGQETYGPTGAADSPRGRRGTRRRRRALPLRGGLLGASAAMAVGAVAVTSGLLPGGDTFTLGSGTTGTPAEHIRSGSAPDLGTQGRTAPAPAPTTAPASRTSTPSSPPSTRSAPRPSATPSRTAAPKPPVPKTPAPSPTRTKTPSPTPERTTTPPAPRPTPSKPAPERTSAPPAPQTPTSRAMAAEAAVLALVNQERATFGCSPLRASTDLGDLARAYSQDMAERAFFDHTDPDGDDPWARASQAGVEGLGGENIARGQADAKAVMEAWMNSEGHRANILNCDFKRLGVGVHFGPGGPWWTQNFGF